MLIRVDRWWAAAILFLNGWIFALPVTDAHLPIWFTPVQVLHGVFVYEALLIVYVWFVVVSRTGYWPSSPRGAQTVGLLIAALGFLGIVSAGINARPLKEYVGSGRYFLLAAYFLSAVYWTRRHGRTFVFRNLLLGIASAGAVTLFYTLVTNSAQLGGLPLLLGQNGPGGYLGIGVILGAWLMRERQTVLDGAVAIVCGAIGIVAASISYSKLAMLIAGAGAIAWWFVIARHLNERRARVVRATTMVALAVILLGNWTTVWRYVEGVKTFVYYKFVNIDQESIASRSQYFLITAEILARNPLFGVSYGGFYDAATATEAYKSDRSLKEDAEAGARGESNPHSSFLYYASADGISGLIVPPLLLTGALWTFRKALSGRGVSGNVLWGALAFGYLIFGLTLPTLFNSSVLYLPVAAVICRNNRDSALARRCSAVGKPNARRGKMDYAENVFRG